MRQHDNKKRASPTSSDLERAERLRLTIEQLYETNKEVPVIVEGKRDANALQKLGLIGEIITLHRGQNLYDFCIDIEERFQKIIILLDWDNNGDNLFKTLSENLKGHWEEFSWFRELLRMLCQKDISTVEGIPKLLKRLEGNERPWY
jgi:5S rRNA maturation endonuclease (ribonuclease M5)